MTTSWLQTLAMGTPPGGPQGSGGSPGLMIGYMVIIFAMFWFLMIRPQMRREKERKKLIENTKSGDRVIFSGGIIGTVTNVREHTFTVKVADNVKIEILRGAVARVLGKDEEPAEMEKNA